MDSLTQITLGAAVGEVLLGRKLGNKAMFWGALGGTVPDMDVLGNAFMSEVDSLVFHRGISHSLFFTVIAPFPLGQLMSWWYKQRWRTTQSFKWIKWSLYLITFLGLVLGIYAITNVLQGSHSYVILILGAFIGWMVFRRYYLQEIQPPDPGYMVSFKEGYWLFFWAILTHIALDIFTSYGTQVFKPFTDTRVAIGSISVVDFLYTLPLLFSIILASFISRSSTMPKKIVIAGLIVSSGYLVFSLVNQIRVKQIFKETLAEQNIIPDRMYVTPYILNNILWHCIAQEGQRYHIGAYSLLDKEPKVEYIAEVQKNENRLGPLQKEKDVQILQWFSNDYYSILDSDGTLFLGDLRYGNGNKDYNDPSDFVFIFRLSQQDGKLIVTTSRNREDINGRLKELWIRIKGRRY